MARLLLSQRGKQKLLFDGYGYVKKRTGTDHIIWICERKSNNRCMATAKTRLDVANGDPVEEIGYHRHERNPSRYDIIAIKNTIKQRAADTMATPEDICTQVVGDISQLGAPNLPKLRSLKRTIRRYRVMTTAASQFTDDQCKYMAEYYVRHFDTLCHDRGFPSKSQRQEWNRLYDQLTTELNALSGTQFTVVQVRGKLQEIKASARQLELDAKKGLLSLDEIDMTEAESIIVSKLMSLRNPTATVTAIDGHQLPNLQSRGQAPSPNQFNDMDAVDGSNESYMASQALHQEFRDDHQPPPHESPISRLRPAGLRTLPPSIRRLSPQIAQQRSNNQKQKEPPSTSGPISDNALRALKRRKLEGDLRLQQETRRKVEGEMKLQEEMRSALAKFHVTMDEMRRYVAEQRLVIRGVDVTGMPVDIPPMMRVPGFDSEQATSDTTGTVSPGSNNASARRCTARI